MYNIHLCEFSNNIFTGRQHSSLCSHHWNVRPSVCLSLRLSVTGWYCAKKTQGRITKLSSFGYIKTLLLGVKGSVRNSKGFTPSEGIKYKWGGKVCDFWPISRCISETVQDRTKVAIDSLTDRKPHTRLRLVPKSTTLADLERPLPLLRTLFQNARVSGIAVKICTKIDPYCQRQKCTPVTLISGSVRFMRIFAGFSGQGRQTTVRSSKTTIFSVFGRYLRNL